MTLSWFQKCARVTDDRSIAHCFTSGYLRNVRGPNGAHASRALGLGFIYHLHTTEMFKFHLQCNQHSFWECWLLSLLHVIYKMCLNRYSTRPTLGSVATLHCTKGPHPEVTGQNGLCYFWERHHHRLANANIFFKSRSYFVISIVIFAWHDVKLRCSAEG